MEMLQEWRQAEIQMEIVSAVQTRNQFIIAEGLKAKLKQDEQSGKWIWLSDCGLSGVGDSAEQALNDLWKNYISEDYNKQEF